MLFAVLLKKLWILTVFISLGARENHCDFGHRETKLGTQESRRGLGNSVGFAGKGLCQGDEL